MSFRHLGQGVDESDTAASLQSTEQQPSAFEQRLLDVLSAHSAQVQARLDDIEQSQADARAQDRIAMETAILDGRLQAAAQLQSGDAAAAGLAAAAPAALQQQLLPPPLALTGDVPPAVSIRRGSSIATEAAEHQQQQQQPPPPPPPPQQEPGFAEDAAEHAAAALAELRARQIHRRRHRRAADRATSARWEPELSGDESDGDDGDELVDLLDKLDASEGSERAANAKLVKLFAGHPLPLVHDPDENPFERKARFRAHTTHYMASRVGDSLHAEMAGQLERRGEQGELHCKGYALELRSLLPACSYLYDTHAAMHEMSLALVRASAAGQLEGTELESLPQVATAITTQVASTLQHLRERLDILRKVADGDDAGLEVMARLYNREASVSGAMSAVGAAVAERVDAKGLDRLVSSAASERAKSTPLADQLLARGARSSFRQPGTFRQRGGKGGTAQTQPARGGAAVGRGGRGGWQQQQPQSQQPARGTQMAAPQALVQPPAQPRSTSPRHDGPGAGAFGRGTGKGGADGGRGGADGGGRGRGRG